MLPEKKGTRKAKVLESNEYLYHNVALDVEILQLVIFWILLLLLNYSHFIGQIESIVYAQYRQDNFSRNLNIFIPYFFFF